MNKKTTSGFTVMEVICCLPLLTAIFIELPLPLQILLPFVSFVSLIGLARLHIAEIRSWKLKIFLEDLESCINDSQDLRKFILIAHKDYQRNPSRFNQDKLMLVRSFLTTHHLSENDILTTDETVSREIRRLFMAHGKVKQFISEYTTTTLEPFFTEEQIHTIALYLTRYYDNENCQVELQSKIPYPSELPLQDFSHFAHNLAELIGHFKKYRQINLFKFLLKLIDLKVRNIHAMYRNSTRITSNTRIPLYRIEGEKNIFSDFVASIQN